MGASWRRGLARYGTNALGKGAHAVRPYRRRIRSAPRISGIVLRSTAIVLCFVAGVAAAQQPYLVKDLRTSGPISGSSYPRNFVAVGPTLYFLASSREASGLWRSDGTAAGTMLVAPMDAGSLFSLGNRLIAFSTNGLRLSDGTATGTVFVDGIPAPSDPIEMNGKLFFLAFPDLLYATDGTPTGTVLITRLPLNGNYPKLLTRFGDRIAFVSDRGVGVTDGTAGGTAFLRQVYVDLNSPIPAVGTSTRFYFEDNDALWVSDGTPAGTAQVKHMRYTSPLAAIGDRALFFLDGTGDPWITDGTAGGTFALAHVSRPYSIQAKRQPVVLNGVAYFAFEDGDGGLALWRSDGTIDGTRIAALRGNRAAIMDISAAAGKLWLSLRQDSKWELWVSDGTSEGTRLVAPISAYQTPRVAFNGRAAFSADDNVHGFEPWASDGTPAGTAMVADLYPNIAPASYPDIRGTAGNGVIFDATGNDDVRGHWISDGTAVATLPFAPTVASHVTYHGRLYFNDGAGGVWRTDGSAEGTQLLFRNDKYWASFAVAADVLYIFQAYTIYAVDGSSDPVRIDEGTSSDAIEAWGQLVFRRDGDPFLHAISGTSAPRLLTTYLQSSFPQTFFPLFTAGGYLCYFVSSPFSSPSTELWRTDGSPASFTRIASFSRFQNPVLLGNAGDRMLFAIDDGVHGREPWVTDGTAEGTSLLADITAGPASTTLRSGVSLGDRALFAADDGTFGLEPWVSDGTPAGTHMVADIAPGKASSIQNEIGVMKGIAFFAATDTAHGVELWRSDGTAGGTQLAGDLEPGPLSSAPNQLTAADDTLYFTAETIANGRELWALPVPGRTISIGDGIATEHAASGRLFVTLDTPATERITARWSALGTPQTVTFQPGELRKAISVPIAPGRGPRAIRVRLDSADGAAVIRPVGNLIVQAEPGQADVEVSVTAGTDRPLVVVTNHGPSPVPWVQLTFTGVSFPLPPQTLGSLRAGERVSVPTYAGLYRATASAPLPDPDPSNNSMTYRAVVDRYTVMTLSPAGLTVGMHAKLSISSGGQVLLYSSDPRVLAVPQSAIAPVEVDVVALAEGTTNLSADRIAYLPVTVGPPGPYRWPVELNFTIENAGLSYGTRRPLLAHVAAISPEGINPGGTVTILDGDKSVVTIPVDANGNAAVNLNSLLPGDHLITATYSGDANLLPAVSPSSVALHIHAPAAVTFRGVVRPVSATEDEATIEVVVLAGTPGGTMTLKDLARNVLAEHVPVIAGRAVAVIPHLTMVTVDYSGDELFAPAVVNVPLTQSRRRASRP